MTSNNGNSDSDEFQWKNNPASAKTVIKYEKSSCYFCNEWLDSQSFTEHLIHCGQVLERCPNSCNTYVPRLRLRSHLKECSKTENNHRINNNIKTINDIENRINILENDIDTFRSVLNEEIRQRLHLITDVGNLRKQNLTSMEWSQKIDENIHELRKLWTQENTQHCYELEQFQNDFRFNFDLVQALKNELQSEVDEFQKQIYQVSFEVNKQRIDLIEGIARLEDNISEQENSLRSKINEMEKSIVEMTSDLHSKFIANTDLNTKQLTMDYEIKSMKNIVCETEERCDKLDQISADIERKMQETLQRVLDLEMHLPTQQRFTLMQNNRGHLIWKIREYSKRMEEARQYDTILHSPMFANKPFGYALRLDVHLNGKGSWKGRNIIACLNVLSGEFDALLPWPCKLQADVIVRDQSNDPDKIQNYTKIIFVRKKNDDLVHSNQYFHIPHQVITSRNYLRSDCLFFEIRVHKNSTIKYM